AVSSALPHVKAGRGRGLAPPTANTSSFNSEGKTLQQLGIPDVDASNWVGMFAPKGTPQPIVDKLNAELAKILAMPDLKERFAAGGSETLIMTSAALDARVRGGAGGLKQIVEKANMKPD